MDLFQLLLEGAVFSQNSFEPAAREPRPGFAVALEIHVPERGGALADEVLEEIPSEVVIRIVDFHAEATSEKIAFGYYLDGRVSAVIGTHTHVQTADERILTGGTAYITDVGMTGPLDSVIGVKKEQIQRRFITGIPERMSVASGSRMINAVMVDINDKDGKAEGIERLRMVFEDKEES